MKKFLDDDSTYIIVAICVAYYLFPANILL